VSGHGFKGPNISWHTYAPLNARQMEC